jgi:L-iditol 2-dehydrogenase
MSHHCAELRALGVHMDGGFAEFVRIPADAVRLGNVVALDGAPDDTPGSALDGASVDTRGGAPRVSFEAAAANEAFSCVYSAFLRYRVHPGETVVIIGAGAIGLMHAKLAKMAGAAKIILNDLSADRLRECAAIEPSLIPVAGGLSEAVARETGGAGADVVITACSAAAAQKAAFTLAALNGRVNFFGGLPKGKELVELDTNQIHYKQLTVTGTTRASHEHYRKTLGFIASGLVDIDPLITHRYALTDIKKAFDNAANAVGLKQAIVF